MNNANKTKKSKVNKPITFFPKYFCVLNDERFAGKKADIACFRLYFGKKYWPDSINQRFHAHNVATAFGCNVDLVYETYRIMRKAGMIDASTGLSLPKKCEEIDAFPRTATIPQDSSTIPQDSFENGETIPQDSNEGTQTIPQDSKTIPQDSKNVNSPSENGALKIIKIVNQSLVTQKSPDLLSQKKSMNHSNCCYDSKIQSQEVSCSQGKNVTLYVNKQTVIIKNIINGTVNTDLNYKLLNLTNTELKQQNKETQNIITNYFESLNTKQIRDSFMKASQDTLAQEYFHNTLKL